MIYKHVVIDNYITLHHTFDMAIWLLKRKKIIESDDHMLKILINIQKKSEEFCKNFITMEDE